MKKLKNIKINLPDDIIYNILNYCNLCCKSCLVKINNKNKLLRSIIISKFIFCSKKCYMFT